jgi:hypothetical protein
MSTPKLPAAAPMLDEAGYYGVLNSGPPAGLLLHLARRRCRRVLAIIDVAARQLPHPPVHDEPMTAHQQHPLATVIKHYGDRDTAHPEHVLREPRVTGNLNIRQADPDMRRVIHQPLTVDKPLVRVTHKPTLPATPQADRRSSSAHSPVPPHSSRNRASRLRGVR